MLTEKEIKHLQPKEKRYRKNDGDNLLLEVMPSGAKYWRLKRRNSFNRLEILQEIRKLEAQGKLETCKKVIGIFRMIFDYGIICGYCDDNPALRLQGAIKTPVSTHFAAFTEKKDIARLMIAINNYTGSISTKCLLLWSAYTFARPTECRRATWKEINIPDRLWIIPMERMKMGEEHIIPLPQQCINLLETLKNFGLSDNWLFPGQQKSKALSENAVTNALRNMGFAKEEMTAHGFRAMASTTLNEMGYRPDLIEKSLAQGIKTKYVLHIIEQNT